jgi:flagellar secretion chaperone FliS
MNYGMGAYKKTSLRTASKEQILLMLYQAAIASCRKAIECIENNDIAGKGEHIAKLQDIIVELSNSLDFKIGGEVANELSSLYDYLLHTSTQANIQKDAALLNSCLSVLNILYQGWKDAIKSLKNSDSETAGSDQEKNIKSVG